MNKSNVTIVPIDINDKSVLRNLVSLYLYDFSELVDVPISEHGIFEYDELDHNWTDSCRHPFFIRYDGRLAGFILIRSGEGSEDRHCISEFFVLRGYRRQGVGKEAAHLGFSAFPGLWRVHVMKENLAAQSFWRSTINEYSKGEYLEDWSEVDRRFIYDFTS